jgi:type I restriction enzyme R subunit
MEAPSFKEDHISQIPALQMLQNLGYTYLTPEEALSLRWGKTTWVILEDILRKQLREINSIRTSSSKTSVFSDSNIESGIYALQNLPFQEGYISASEYVYNLLTLGKSLEQSIDWDKRSFNLRYIDWDKP